VCSNCDGQIEKISPTTFQELREVAAIMTSQDPMARIEKHLDNICAGETRNKRNIFRAAASGKKPDPTKKMIVILKGEPGGGKSQLLRITESLKTKKIGRFSEHALDYSNLADFEVLYIQEVGSMDREEQGISTLKFLSSDDKGYTVEVTILDKDSGRPTTATWTIPPITVFTSTTRVVLDSQFERRALIINPDETREQTDRIRIWKANRDKQLAEVDLGLRPETDEAWSMRVLTRFFTELKPVKVLVPFTQTLYGILGSRSLRIRGDFDKLRLLLELDSMIRQRTLPGFNLNEQRFVIATPEQAVALLTELKEPLLAMALDLEKRSREMIGTLEKLGITQAGDIIDKDQRDELAKMMSRNERTIRRFLDEWAESGYVSDDGKKPKAYNLLVNLDEIDPERVGMLDIERSSNEFILKCQKEIQDWVRLQLDKLPLILRDATEIDPVAKAILDGEGLPPLLSNPNPSNNTTVQGENRSENRTEGKCPTCRLGSEENLEKRDSTKERQPPALVGFLADKIEQVKAWLSDNANLDDERFGDRLKLTEEVGVEVMRILEENGMVRSHPTKPNKVRLVRG